MTSISLCLPDDVAERLEDLAKLTGRPKTHFAIEAICQHLDDLEDIYISKCRLEEMRSRKVIPLSLDKLIENHGMDS